jgi:septal ring factor EnvC (AmiA/AmiB activator)
MSRNVDDETLAYCQWTCPDVDGAFDCLLEDLEKYVAPHVWDSVRLLVVAAQESVKKDGTYKLRDALREAVSDKRDVESERDELEGKVSDLEREVDSLKEEVQDLGDELSRLKG